MKDQSTNSGKRRFEKLLIENVALIKRALFLAGEWEDTILDAYHHIQDDPEYRSAIKRAARYRLLLKKIHYLCNAQTDEKASPAASTSQLPIQTAPIQCGGGYREIGKGRKA